MALFRLFAYIWVTLPRPISMQTNILTSCTLVFDTRIVLYLNKISYKQYFTNVQNIVVEQSIPFGVDSNKTSPKRCFR